MWLRLQSLIKLIQQAVCRHVSDRACLFVLLSLHPSQRESRARSLFMSHKTCNRSSSEHTWLTSVTFPWRFHAWQMKRGFAAPNLLGGATTVALKRGREQPKLGPSPLRRLVNRESKIRERGADVMLKYFYTRNSFAKYTMFDRRAKLALNK